MAVMARQSSALSLHHAARLLATTALTAPLWMSQALSPALAQNLPTGASVAAGAVSIAQPSTTQMTITQSSQSAVVNYNAFSIGAGHGVTVAQPNASAALLNRVTGDTPSSIAGTLTANGQVYLVNPNGIAITRSGVVNVGGGFVASTLGISDSDFMSGKRTFTGNGASASVSNAGTIRVGRGGYAALIGGTVDNSGLIEAPLGKVGLGSGEQATLDFAGDGFLQVAMPTQAGGNGKALVSHSGRIKADGGSVVISAATAREAARNAINLSGHVQARSISGRSGSITIGGGAGGAVRISGKLNVASRKAKGGKITVTGRDTTLQGARIDASGKNGGGQVKIGGDWQGQGSLQRAETTSIDAATSIKADARDSGNGGKVVVWSDQATSFAGTISAKGGAQGGNGGDAEVSGKATLAYTGFANLSAPNGSFGTLLLDPYNVTISSGADSNHTGFTATGNDSVINATTLQTALGAASVTVSTGAGGGQAGDITVAAPLTWSSTATLTLQAANAITLNNAVTAHAGGLALDAGGSITTGAGGAVDVARFTLQNGAWTQNIATPPAFAADDFRIAGGSFLRASGGAGTSADPWRLADIYGVQGMATYLSGHFALANDIDASGTAAWWDGQGFVPIGRNPASFTGSLDGAGHAISDLVIDRPGADYVGLFGFTGAGSAISNIGLSGVVRGKSSVGGLIGLNQSGTIINSHADVEVTGAGNAVGGLVGWLFGGSVDRSYATGAVTGGVGGGAGGLVGYSYTPLVSAITRSYATGAVTGTNNVGGLVGFNRGSVSDSYATGSVTGSSAVGGLVGQNQENGGGDAKIARSWASGLVTGTSAGGLVGSQSGGSTSNSYWDSYSTGQGSAIGGAPTGTVTNVASVTSDPAQSGAANYAYKQGAYGYLPFTIIPGGTGSFMIEGQTRPFGAWEYSTAITNGHQLQLVSMDLTASYTLARDIDLAGLFGRAGAASPTAAQSAGMWSGGFVPIGTDGTGFVLGGVNETGGFKGSLAGGGHVISALRVDRTAARNGLFGHVGGTGSITDVGLDGGLVKGGASTGALAGVLFGNISGSWSSVTVAGTSNVGGLVGQQDGSSSVTRSYATGTVTGSVQAIGGLVGQQVSGDITQAYATGTVTGGSRVGGLVGWEDDGTITQAYATGAVTGSTNVGGLVGRKISGTITQAYATGLVTGAADVGGLIGFRSSPSGITAAYYDSFSTGMPVGVGSGAQTNVLAVTSDSTKSADGNYAYKASAYNNGGNSLTFTATPGASGWTMVEGQTRPFGAWEYSTAITNGHQLQLVNMALNASYTLARDIDLTGQFGRAGVASPTAAQSAGMWNSGFVPIGTDGAGNRLNANKGFGGAFDGRGHTISNLTVDIGAASQAGLFGYATGSVISNITLAGGSVKGYANVGGLVGSLEGGSIARASTTGTVTGTNNQVGGLVGWQLSNGAIRNSQATGDVNGGQNVGGLVGSQSNGGITDSYATGKVNGSFRVGGLVGLQNGGTVARSYHETGLVNGTESIGGLIGYQSGVVTDSRAGGAVTGSQFVGGLVGQQFAGGISDSHATGKVTATGDNIGGLVGQSSGTITDSYASGEVTGGHWYTGGLVGAQGNGTITRSYATGAVTGDGTVGGLVGQQAGTASIVQSFATGAVTGGTEVGGLVGLQYYGGSITRSYATGAAAGNYEVGGLVGFQYFGGSVTESYATGAVTGNYEVGGLVGRQFNGGTVTTSYFDTETTGQSGPGGLTTAALQAALQAGFDPAVWGILSGVSYPYLAWRFPNGPSVVSGKAIDIAGGNDRLSVGLGVDGVVTAFGHTGANGYYHFMIDPVAADSVAVTWLTGERFAGSSTASRANAVGEMPAFDLNGVGRGVAGGLDLYADTVTIKTALPTFTAIATMMERGLYGDRTGAPLYAQVPDSDVLLYDACGCDATVAFHPGVPGGQAQASVRLEASAQTLTWDGGFDAVLPARNVTILAAGDVVVTSGSGIVADDLDDAGGGAVTMDVKGSLTLEPSSLIGSANGSVAMTVKGDLTLDADALLRALAGGIAADVDGNISLGGMSTGFPQVFSETIRLRAGGDFTMAPDTYLGAFGTGDAIQIAVGGRFVNQGAADPNDPLLTALVVDPAQARWLVYLNDPNAGHTFGYLDSQNTAIWNTGAFAPVAAAGNRYVFAYQPLLTFTSEDAAKVYGATAVSLTHTVSGLMAGVDGAYLGDTEATAYSGDPSLSSAGVAPTAGVGSYAITIADNGLTSATGYGFQFVSSGLLTVNPAALTITANDAAKSYGQTVSFAGTEFTVSGLQNGESVDAVTLISLGAAATAGVGGSPYAITASAARGGSTFDAANYVITYVDGQLTVTPAALTITANDAAKSYGQTVGFAGTEFTASGLQNGESVGAVTLTSLGAAATAGVGGSPYAIAASDARGGTFDAANYVITYVDGQLTVTPAALTVTADAQSRLEGAANPPLTYRLDGTLFNDDTIQGGLATEATIASLPGAYPITQGTLGVSANYVLTYRGALLTVLPGDSPAPPPAPAPVIDATAWASRIFLDGIKPVILPDNARPVFGATPVVTPLGPGVLYADPRFEQAYVCFGGGGGLAQVCFAARS